MPAAERALERLVPHLPERRWYAGKHRALERALVRDVVPVTPDGSGLVVVATLEYGDGGAEAYAIPSTVRAAGLVEAGAGDALWRSLLAAVREGRVLPGVAGALACHPPATAVSPSPSPPVGGRPLTLDQSNTSVVLDEEAVVKCYRRLEPGRHPEPELLEALAGLAHVPAYLGHAEYVPEAGEASTLCVAQGFVAGEPVGWEGMIERVASGLAATGRAELDTATREAEELGAVTGALHVALVATLGLRALDREAAGSRLGAARRGLDDACATGTGVVDEVLRALIESAVALLEPLGREGLPVSRVHGDLHVGQFLRGAGGLVVVDLEGEPVRPLAARRRDDSPLRDLASLLLSLDHVAMAAARRIGEAVRPRSDAWADGARAAAAAAYTGAVAGVGIVVDPALLRALELEKECAELLYAARYLPEWLYAPAQTMPRILARAAVA